MSLHDDSVRLRHMLDACREAVQFSQGRPRSDLDSDRIDHDILWNILTQDLPPLMSAEQRLRILECGN